MIAESAAASALLAFALGNRHGLDADHLAAIDGMTRWNSSARRPIAALCGVLFSVGHAGVIVALCVALFAGSISFVPPVWLETAGTLISGVTLLMLGLINLRSAGLDARLNAPVGLKSRFLGRFVRASRPWQVTAVGALFALSFDSVAIAAFFASSTSALGEVLLVASSFAIGMLCVGGANGWWVVRLIRQSQSAGRHGTRVMTLTIALVSLLVSARVLMPLMFASSAEWLADGDWLLSIGVMTVVLAGYGISGWIVRRSSAKEIEYGVKSCVG